MVLLLYNKVLLRIIVVLAGAGVVLTTWYYVTLSAQKLGALGVRDALAIVSFFFAGWLVMVIAEVVDNHYVRAFACLCVLLGAVISFRWIFLVDGPKLRELAGGAAGMQLAGAGFWTAVLLALAMFALLVVRLVLDKLNVGRRPAAAAAAEVNVSLGAKPEGLGQAEAEQEPPAIPLDTAAPAVTVPADEPTEAPPRGGPVSKLTGIGGMYLGTEFALAPGQYTVGRREADLLLADDNQVSRRHAQLAVSEAGEATLTDAGSTNGTFVNNQRVETIVLAPGDVIRIGTTLFKAEA
jgi:hypothetical protein